MKTLKGILEQSKMYATPDTERFVAKHVVTTKKPSKAEEDDKLFKATNIKTVNRETEHGYNPGSDEAVYEQAGQVDEKTLTPAEMKKREEVAQAIERENPNMPMAKKMAIATSTAKKVAEEVEQLDERVVHDQYNNYHQGCLKMMSDIGKHLDAHKKAVMSPTEWNKEKGANTSEWHVQQVKSLHRQLQDIADNMQQSAEYAQPPKPVKLKEDINEELSEDEIEDIVESILENLSEQERIEFLEMMETEEGCKEIVEMLDGIFKQEQLEE